MVSEHLFGINAITLSVNTWNEHIYPDLTKIRVQRLVIYDYI